MPTASNLMLQVEVERRLIVSRSPATQRVMEIVRRTAPVDVSVMISGETGTGKELIARLIHKWSPRASGEFVALDCNAIPSTVLESELFGHERGAFTGADQHRVGVFELASGTSLFLDEIANLPLQQQSKLLRVLQERSFRRIGGRRMIPSDFRLITATNSDLAACVHARSFREDLFYRLSVVHVHLPPLRERREDIPLLVSHFVDKKRLRLKRPEICRVSHQAVDLLTSYNWPGNVRELENVIENAILSCPGDTIEEADLVFGTHIAPPGPSGDRDDTDVPFRVARQRALAMFERLYLLANLRQHRGSIKKTALRAEITTKHVRELMRRHGIERRDFRPPLRARPVSPADGSTVKTGTPRRRA